MQRFPGKIRFPEADTDDVAAVLTVHEQSLEIVTGETSIGSWPVAEIELELGASGYHVTLDGENLVLSPHDRFGFSHAVEDARQAATVRRSRRGRRKAAKRAKAATQAAAAPPPAAEEAGPVTTLEPAAPAAPPDEPTPAEKQRPRRQKAPKAKKVKTRERPAKPPKPAKVRKRKQRDPDAPKPVPHVPGLEDPDRDALWATHRTHEPTSFRERLNTSEGVRKLALIAIPVVAVLLYFAPALIAVALLVPGAAAIVLAGLAMLDPSFTRYIPASLSDLRLMLAGVGCFLASLLVAWIF